MNLIVTGIIACEIGFWVVLGAGLFARYLLRAQRLSTVLLACVPLIDLALLSLIAWDLLANQEVADFAHGLGAIYLGFTVAFGRQIIARTDVIFAHRFADGPAPVKPPTRGVAAIRYEWQQWFRMVLCAVIASIVLGAMILLVADTSRTDELLSWIGRVWLIAGIWLLGWPIWVTVREGFTPHATDASPSNAPDTDARTSARDS
ncbi:hypothetical protein [Leucobacter sp. 1207-22]|uniref:hypothetical protein n=1 Tax=Leucobacter sp. 1207-22 TaxID=2604456 RepID=UPI004063C6D8